MKLLHMTLLHTNKIIRVGNFWSKNYIKCDSDGDRNSILSIKEYLNEIKPYLKDHY